MLGNLSSTARAQVVDSETQFSPATPESTNLDSPKINENHQIPPSTIPSNLSLPETEPHPLHSNPVRLSQTQSEENQPSLEVQPPPAQPDESPVIELEQPSRPLTEAEFLAEPVNPPTTTPPVESEPINPNTAQTSETTPSYSLKVNPRLGVQFTTGPGVGYSDSYGSFEGFVPLGQTPGSNLTFLEGRLLLSTENALASGNIILGHRFYSPNNNRTFGGYVAFDARNTGNSSFNQLGVGVETLGETWDARANAYFPIGDTRQLAQEQVFNSPISVSDPFFQGNFLAQTRNQQRLINRRYEAAMTGFDVEAGVKVAQLGQTGDLRAYGGLYYYDAPGSSGGVGWRTRLEARRSDTFKLGLAVSGDPTFGTNVVLSVGLSFPSSRPSRIKKSDQVVARLGDSVTRNSYIAVDEQVESQSLTLQDTVFVTNPATGQPWRFRHVNLGIGTGNGTFESPTGTMAEALTVAQANDIVYVQPGTNPGVPAFQIPDGVSVLSTGPVQQINTVQLGTFQLPLSGAGVFPTVTGTVTMGNNTTLSGFAISSTTGPGVLGTGVSNVTLRDNAIANSATQGISLQNVTGAVIRNHTISNSASEGISLNNVTGVEIGNTAIANSATQGISLQNVTGAAIGNSTITNSGSQGILMENVNGVEIGNSTITDSASEGIALNNSAEVVIRDNAIANSGTQGISLGNITGAEIRNNTIANSGSEGVLLENVAGQVVATNNRITNSGAEGFSINNNQGQINLNLTENTITGNGASADDGDGVNIELRNNALGTFNIANNQIANNSGVGGIADGIDIKLFDAAQSQFNIANNQILDNQFKGTSIELESTANGTFNLIGNTIANNQGDGAAIRLSDSAQGTVTLANNQITNNGIYGVGISLSSNTQGTFNITNNTISDNTDNGIFAQISDNAQGTLNILNNPEIARNGFYGILTATNQNAILRTLIESNNIVSNPSSGLSISSFDEAQTFAGVRFNTLTGGELGDVEAITISPDATICLQPRNNTIGTLFLFDLLGGPIQVEEGTLSTNTITTSNLDGWSGTTVPLGTCGF